MTAWRWRALLVGVLAVAGVGGVVPAFAAQGPPGPSGAAAEDQVLAKLQSVPGLTVVEERPAPAPYRFFVLDFEQLIDHAAPSGGTFRQRLTLMHRDVAQPVVLSSTGYDLPSSPFAIGLTRTLGGNQLMMEHRFFGTSRPSRVDWSKLTIWQAATDFHRVVAAFKTIYPARWISTGGSKGGMTAVYHRRFYPDDVNGTVAYSAPNDVDDAEDSAYERFFEQVGTPECRAAVEAVQVEALKRRDRLVPLYAAWAVAKNRTFEAFIGDVDRAFEYVVTEAAWDFWQDSDFWEETNPQTGCAPVPTVTATDETLLAWFDAVAGLDDPTDEGLERYVPYYYQAGTQLGMQTFHVSHLREYLRYPDQTRARTFVPREIPMVFENQAMADIDAWVQSTGRELMFIYGENDPWAAERFRVGPGQDSYIYVAPGAAHSVTISVLAAPQQTEALETVRRWAGVSPPPATPDPALDAEPKLPTL
jgi:hypothetical protein